MFKYKANSEETLAGIMDFVDLMAESFNKTPFGDNSKKSTSSIANTLFPFGETKETTTKKGCKSNFCDDKEFKDKTKCYDENIDVILKKVFTNNKSQDVKIIETDTYKTYSFMLPGLEKQDVSVKIDYNMQGHNGLSCAGLIVECISKNETLFIAKDYKKSIELGYGLEIDECETKMSNGILEIKFPKKESKKEIAIK